MQSSIPELSPTSIGVRDALRIDAAATVERLAEHLRTTVAERLRRRGLVVGLSGGVDSSVTAALAVRALGRDRVLGLVMPERDSADADARLAGRLTDVLGIQRLVEPVGQLLDAVGSYSRRDQAIRSVVPDFGPGWRSKLCLGGDRFEREHLNVTYLVVEDPEGQVQRKRLPAPAYRQIVAATNFKQRVRTMLEYYHADRLHYAVAGTPNRLEYDQGFFVKGGDGLADVKPIAHLYKSQVYELAEHLGLPREITERSPTTGTFSLPQTQEEFYFSLPLRMLDAVLYGHDAGLPPETVAIEIGLTAEQVRRAYRDVDRKRATTRYLHLTSLLLEPVESIA